MRQIRGCGSSAKQLWQPLVTQRCHSWRWSNFLDTQVGPHYTHQTVLRGTGANGNLVEIL